MVSLLTSLIPDLENLSDEPSSQCYLQNQGHLRRRRTAQVILIKYGLSGRNSFQLIFF